MASIHQLFDRPPPHRWHPLKDCAEPRDYLPADLIRRRVADEPIDLFDAREKAVLADAGYRWSWRDELDAYAMDLRAVPAFHATTAILSALGTLALLVLPFALGWLK